MCVCIYVYDTHIYDAGWNSRHEWKIMGWQAGKREALVKALTTASLTASHNLKPLLKTPTIESVAIVQFMVLRFPRLLTRCHTLAKNCQLLGYAAGTGVANRSKGCSMWLHISLRDAFHIQKEKNFQCACLPLCADDMLGQIWSYVSHIGKCKHKFNFDCGYF